MPKDHPSKIALVSQLVDEDLLELVEMFVAELPDRVAAIEQAVELEDLDSLSGLAHQLKGSAGSYGFPSISDAARQLEFSAKRCEDWNALTRDVDELNSLCRRACVRGVPTS